MKLFFKAMTLSCVLIFSFYGSLLSAKDLTPGQVLAAGWQYYNQGRLIEAAQCFSDLQQNPDPQLRNNAIMGLGYTRLKQGQIPQAQALFSHLVQEGYELEKTLPALMEATPEGAPQRAETARRILEMDPEDEFALTVSAWDYYHNKNYGAAQAEFERLAAVSGLSPDLRIGLGYSLAHQKKIPQAIALADSLGPDLSEKDKELRENIYNLAIQEALDQNRILDAQHYFYRLVQADPSRCNKRTAGLGSQILETRMTQTTPVQAWELARQMHSSDLACANEAAAQFYARHNAPVTAAQVFHDPEACFFNADTPRIDVSAYYRHRSGDPGLSRLNETAFPISAAMAFPLGHQFTVSHIYTRLDSGDPAAFRAGSYYWYENGSRPKASLGNTATFHQLWLDYKKEGPYPFRIAVGTSPVGGDVSTTPLFDIDTRIKGVDIDIHRSPVTDSILSYAGLEDPYGDAPWGRVTRNGAKLGYTLVPWKNGWVSMRLGFDLYRGENVQNNTALLADLAVGKTRVVEKIWEVSYGLYGAYQHFEHNANFFTYGHGGYYSPEHMISAGPLLRIKSRPCLDFYLDFQASAGWMWEQTADAPFYPTKTATSSLSPAGEREYNGVYTGDTDTGPTALLQLEAWKLLTRKLALGGHARVNLTTDYNEWQVGLSLKYYFKNQNKFHTEFQALPNRFFNLID